MEISRVIYANPITEFDVAYTHDIAFASRDTGTLYLQLLSPIGPEEDGAQIPKDARAFPLVVDVPGSGWRGAEGYRHVPRMVELAKQGFVVACVAYRGTFKDDVRFPAAVQDVKEAIRFLRANAAKYHIDVDHVTLIGDSSGGHTVAMAALTGAESRFNIGAHLDMSTDVNACVLFYAPLDLSNLVNDRVAEGKTLRSGEGEFPYEAREVFQDDYLKDPAVMFADASPINYIGGGEKLPAFLLLQGEDDAIIPMKQSIRFCERVREAGGRAEFVKIAGGEHGATCWTPEAMQLIIQFLRLYK